MTLLLIRRLLPLAAGALLTAIVPPPTMAFVPPQEAPQPGDPSPFSEAALVAELQGVVPGRPFWVGLHLTLEPGWHSYWKNPGDSGMATSIEWHLPPGFSAGEIRWPFPERIEFPPLVSYGYYDEVLLLVRITPPPQVAPGDSVVLAGRADWLVCIEDCFPAEADLELRLPVGSADSDVASPASAARLFAGARAQLPLEIEGWRAAAGETDDGYFLTLMPGADTGPGPGAEGAYFFPEGRDVLDHAAPQTVVREDESGEFTLSLARSGFSAGAPSVIRGVLVAPEGRTWDPAGEARALSVRAPLVTRMVTGREVPLPPARADGLTLPLALLFAFVGGLILNLMPCVFPVLSLKVLGFVEHAGQGAGEARRHGMAFGAGVVFSFWVLGGTLLLLRAAGQSLGWGFQLQSPAFVGAMAVLFFVLSLMLLGVFEVGTGLARLTLPLAGTAGYGGSLGAGVLATVVATPCTAPFMGAALGFALLRPTAETMAVFTALGAGMAAPYVVLSASPRLLERLPPPGPWMDAVKKLLALPLLATVAWLGWVFAKQTGPLGFGRLIAVLAVVTVGALIARWWGRATAEPGMRRIGHVAGSLAGIVALVLLVRAARTVPSAGGASDGMGPTSVASEWLRFDASTVDSLVALGRPVFVDFTAAWCLSCQVNERVVLHTDEVLSAFRAAGVSLVRADWTRRDRTITEALAVLGRSSVPVYALYPGGDRPPILLPSVLTRDLVLSVLESHVSGAPSTRTQGGPDV